jgi:hypothetical protein
MVVSGKLSTLIVCSMPLTVTLARVSYHPALSLTLSCRFYLAFSYRATLGLVCRASWLAAIG